MKKVLIGVAALLVVVVGGLVFVWSNLDSIVKNAIETYGSEATKTTVSVAEVKLTLENGEAKISGLKVGNPAGFTDPNIFELGMISTKIDTSTINQNPIIIDEIIISAPAVVYEINQSGLSNVDVLKKNLGSGSGGGGKSSAASESSGESGGEALKMIIRKLVVEGTSAKVRIAALGTKEQSVKLPRILLTDVGKKSGGATAAEVAQILSSKLIGNVKGSVGKLGVSQYLGKSAEDIKKQMMKQVAPKSGGSNPADALKGLFGN
ncbi:MAG TPA: hypothetical protein VKA23_02870 [Mariprofundaceae bacterium]|nr:hypothetical protein [Mariprofundaceae bacterium]